MHKFYLFRYSEVCKPGYNFDTDKDQMGAGHFTQVF